MNNSNLGNTPLTYTYGVESGAYAVPLNTYATISTWKFSITL